MKACNDIGYMRPIQGSSPCRLLEKGHMNELNTKHVVNVLETTHA